MRTTTAIAVLSVFALPAVAEQNRYELTKMKSDEMVVTKSSYTIELAPGKAYDKYIISVSGDGGFSYQFESQLPILDVSKIDLR